MQPLPCDAPGKVAAVFGAFPAHPPENAPSKVRPSLVIVGGIWLFFLVSGRAEEELNNFSPVACDWHHVPNR